MHVRYRNRYGRERSYYTAYEGVIPFLERRHTEAESETSRERYEGYMREVPCPACKGARLKPEVLAVTLAGRSIAEIAALRIAECAVFLRDLELDERQRMIAERVSRRSTSGWASCSTSASTTCRSTGRPARSPAARRSGSAWPRRSAPGWSACSTCSTSRASGCTSATTTG